MSSVSATPVVPERMFSRRLLRLLRDAVGMHIWRGHTSNECTQTALICFKAHRVGIRLALDHAIGQKQRAPGAQAEGCSSLAIRSSGQLHVQAIEPEAWKVQPEHVHFRHEHASGGVPRLCVHDAEIRCGWRKLVWWCCGAFALNNMHGFNRLFTEYIRAPKM